MLNTFNKTEKLNLTEVKYLSNEFSNYLNNLDWEDYFIRDLGKNSLIITEDEIEDDKEFDNLLDLYYLIEDYIKLPIVAGEKFHNKGELEFRNTFKDIILSEFRINQVVFTIDNNIYIKYYIQRGLYEDANLLLSVRIDKETGILQNYRLSKNYKEWEKVIKEKIKELKEKTPSLFYFYRFLQINDLSETEFKDFITAIRPW